MLKMGRETLAILDRGTYSTGDRRVRIAAELEYAVRNTQVLEPEHVLRRCRPERAFDTTVRVTEERTQDAARCLVQDEGHDDPVVLNFASAWRPGGGFLRGAVAQEEDLARSSGLYRCLESQPAFYESHRALGSPLYTDAMIYSPKVPWFRGGDGELLADPFLASVITSPAPNARRHLDQDRARESELVEVLNRRAGRILELARARGHDTLVLGAWGCGAFGNRSEVVAEAFLSRLEWDMRGAFRHVCFAIYDTSASKATLRAFRDRVDRSRLK
jgi:uncharacterized protein (TIGR02452 family)